MQNKSVLKRIALFLILTLAVSFVLPSEGVMAIGQYLEVQTKRDTIIQQSNITLPKGLYDSVDVSPVVSEPKINTELGNLAVDLSNNFDRLKKAYTSNDLSLFKHSIKDMLELLSNYSKSIQKDLDKNEEILGQLDTEKGEQRNSKFRAEINQKLLEFKESFEEFAEFSKSIKDLNGAEAVKVKDGLNKIEKIFMPGQPENPIGSNLPYRNVSAQPKVASIGAEAAAPYMSAMDEEGTSELPKEPQPEDLAETDETKLTNKIKELADSLGTPVNIYEYVRNNMEFEPYYGSRKGAQGTLSHKGGNDYDQASLLISMLRYKKIPARYVRGQAEIEIDRAMAWTGADTPEAAAQILASAGTPVTSMVSGGKINAVRVEHVWVEAYVPYDRYRGAGPMKGQSIWIPLDPSYKLYEKIEGISNIEDIIGINSATFDKAVKEQDTNTGKITGINKSGYDALVNSASEKLQKYITDNHLEDKTLADVFGGFKIKPQNFGLLPASLPYKKIGNVSKFNKITEKYSDMVSFGVYGSDPYGLNFTGDKDFSIQYKSVELYNKKVTLSYEPATKEDADIIKQYGDIFSVPAYLVKMVPVLKVDGESVAKGKEIGLGYRQQFEIGIKSTGREKELINNDFIAGSFYNVGFDYQIVSEDELQTISDRLKDSEYTAGNIYTDEKLGEILNFVAKSYFMEMDLINEILMQQMEVSSVRLLSEGITGFRANVKYLFSAPVELSNGGLYIDVDSNTNSVVSRSGDKEVERQYMVASGMISSALEHSIWEQATGIESVSTIKVLEVAAEREIPIYVITKENYSEYEEKLKLSSSVKSEIGNAVNGGKVVTVASEEITLGDWTGAGYIVMDPETGSAGYMISGGLAGGATSIWVDLAALANIGFAIWDFVEAIQLIATGIGLLAAGPLGIALGIVVILLGVISLIFAIISVINTIDLWIKYHNGDAEAGEEILGDVALNAILALATFGVGQAIKPIAKSIKKAKAVKALGEEVVEQMVKNGDSYDDIMDLLKALKKAGVSDDVAKDVAERFGKEGLDLVRQYGDDAAKAMKKGIDPDTIKKLDELGIDPSDYDNMGIDNLDDAKAAIRSAEGGNVGGKTLDIVKETDRFIDYINESGTVVRIPKQDQSSIAESISRKLSSTDIGESTEAKVADYISKNTDAKITEFGNKVKTTNGSTLGDIDVATDNTLIEVKKSISSVKDGQLYKYIDSTNNMYLNAQNKKVILYIDEVIDLTNPNNVKLIEKIEGMGITVVNSIGQLKGVVN